MAEASTTTKTAPATTEPAPKPMGASDLRQMAEDYHVPMTTQTIDSIVGDSKEISPEKAKVFEDYVKRQAMGLYPTLAPQIEAGLKTTHLLEPYRQVGKQILGDDFEPNFQTDPKMRAALQGSHDPATGRPAPMSLSEWQTHLKSDPGLGYRDSPQGQQETADMKQKIVAALRGGA